jgi:membrane protein
VGGATLMATSILMIGNVERALNAIWGVRRQRSWVRRVPDYLAVLLIAPVVLGVAISLGTTLRSQTIVQRLLEFPGFATVYDLGLQQAPTVLMMIGFSFVYWFLPNTEVRAGSALLGGLFAGLLFTLAQSAYINLSVGAARYNALFSGLAWIPLFMVWVYFSWAITLLGAEVAFAYQTLPLYRREVREAGAGPATRESIGLALVLAVAQTFRDGGPPWSDDALSEQLDVPVRTVRDLIGKLQSAGVLVELGGEERLGTYQLGRPADRIRVADVLEALRGPRETPHAPPKLGKVVTEVFAQLDRESAGAAGARTLRELLEAAEAPADPPGTAP